MLPFTGSAERHLVKATAWQNIMAAYCRVYGVIHFTSPAGCTPGSAPGPTLGKEYGKTLPLTLPYRPSGSRVVSVLDSGAEGPGFKSQPRAVG